ncbi:MAG TPA: hypothetical protein VNN20_04370 [Thermodesulfobacteriota bacterium]|nr:hypothetical protein [Thermodesulfobacteriota bacterium]
MSKKLLGELLIEAGLINKEKLNHALKLQKEQGGKFGQILVRLGYISMDSLVDFLSKQHSTKSFDLGKEIIDERAIGLISEKIAKKYKAVPIKLKSEGANKKLVVAMVEPSNLETIDSIKFMTGYDVEPVFIMEENLSWLINYCYHRRWELR